MLGLVGLALASLVSWASQRPAAGCAKVFNETWALSATSTGRCGSSATRCSTHHVHFAVGAAGVHLVEISTLLAIAYVIFRPLAAPRALPAPAVRRLAVDVVRAHGQDSLSFFKLRADKQYFFNEDRTAFVGYRSRRAC